MDLPSRDRKREGEDKEGRRRISESSSSSSGSQRSPIWGYGEHFRGLPYKWVMDDGILCQSMQVTRFGYTLFLTASQTMPVPSKYVFESYLDCFTHQCASILKTSLMYIPECLFSALDSSYSTWSSMQKATCQNLLVHCCCCSSSAVVFVFASHQHWRLLAQMCKGQKSKELASSSHCIVAFG